MGNNNSSDLYDKVESLKNLLISVATGGHRDNLAYSKVRKLLLGEPTISTLLPRFVHTCADIHQFWQYIKYEFDNYRERRDFLHSQFEKVLKYIKEGGAIPSLTGAIDTFEGIDYHHVCDAWTNAYNRRIVDPEGAITSARSLLETVCKHILDDAGDIYEDSWNLTKLYKKAASRLNLSPDQHNEAVFKQILSGCNTVVEGLGSLRNKFGDAHGKGSQYVKPTERHAALAVNLAGTVATFLIKTLEERELQK
jgi:hypothetical protein